MPVPESRKAKLIVEFTALANGREPNELSESELKSICPKDMFVALSPDNSVLFVMGSDLETNPNPEVFEINSLTQSNLGKVKISNIRGTA